MRRHGSKNRSLGSRVFLVVAPPLFACLMSAAHASLGDSLDLLWILLTGGVFAHWILRRRPGSQPGTRELLSLTLALALLFPVISADDDLFLFDLPSDAQCLFAGPEKEKHAAVAAKPHMPAAITAPYVPTLLYSLDLVPESGRVATLVLSSHATGNHSPPLC